MLGNGLTNNTFYIRTWRVSPKSRFAFAPSKSSNPRGRFCRCSQGYLEDHSAWNTESSFIHLCSCLYLYYLYLLFIFEAWPLLPQLCDIGHITQALWVSTFFYSKMWLLIPTHLTTLWDCDLRWCLWNDCHCKHPKTLVLVSPPHTHIYHRRKSESSSHICQTSLRQLGFTCRPAWLWSSWFFSETSFIAKHVFSFYCAKIYIT